MDDETTELRALVSWMCTFPQINVDGKDMPKYDENAASTTSANYQYELRAMDWLSDKDVALCILHAVKEIKKNSKDSDEMSDSSSVSSDSSNEDDQVLDVHLSKSSYFSSVDDIWNHISDTIHYRSEYEGGTCDFYCSVMEAFLPIAVGVNCRMRETYIKRIMELEDSDVKRTIMQIIERNMKNSVSSPCEESTISRVETPPNIKASCMPDPLKLDYWIGSSGSDSDSDSSSDNSSCNSDLDIETSLSNTPKPSNHKRSRDENSRSKQRISETEDLSPQNIDGKRRRISVSNGDDHITRQEPILEIQLVDLRRRVGDLTKEKKSLQELVEKHKKDEVNVEELQSTFKAKTMKMETEAIDRENRLKSDLESKIMELDKMKHDHESARVTVNEQESKIRELTDEVDILQHCRQKLETSEEQLRKFKTRLEEFQDMKDALRKEEQSHNEAIERCLGLENKLTALEPLRRQVESYRNKSTESELKLAECEDKLQRIQSSYDSLMESHESLKEISKFQEENVSEMKQRLSTDEEIGGDIGSLGNALSETNPILKEELLRLRNENHQLRIYKARTSQDNVVDMEDQLHDSNRLASTFKERLFKTQANLDETQQLLANSEKKGRELRQKILDLERNIRNLEREKEQIEQNFKDTVSSMNEKAAKELKDLDERRRREIEQERARSQMKEDELNETLKTTKELHEAKVSCLEQGHKAQIETNAQMAADKLREAEEQFNERIETIKHDAQKERDDLMNKGKDLYKQKKDVLVAQKNKYKKGLESSIAQYKEFEEKTTKEKQLLEEQSRRKISSLNHKLSISLTKQDDLEKEIENLEGKNKKLEREKREILEDNERYRRHVGSRLGSEKSTENQFETLQREYNQILKENRLLKQRGHSNLSLDNPNNTVSNENTLQSEGIKVNNTVLSEMRDEYNSKMNEVNDARRELIMRNSAAISELQKANQRAWKLEEELGKVKSDLTSAKLALQRYEHAQRMEQMAYTNSHTSFQMNYSNNKENRAPSKPNNYNLSSANSFEVQLDPSGSSDTCETKVFAHSLSDDVNSIATSGSVISQATTAMNYSHGQTRGVNRANVRKTPKSHKKVRVSSVSAGDIPSIFSKTQPGKASEGGKPECTQS